MKFRWNEFNEPKYFWDTDSDEEKSVIVTDKGLINNPNQGKFEDVLRSLCRVVSELVELEEKK